MLKRRRYKALRMKEPKCIVDPLREDQVRHFLSSLKRYRDVAIALLMLLCGLRSREILAIKLGEVAFDLNRIKVNGKGNKERMLPMASLVVDALSRYLDYERPKDSKSNELFVVMQGKRRGLSMTRAGLRRIFRTRRLQVEIANANPHRFRHTFGADMARAGVRLPVLRKMMGHAHAETTLRYVNLSMADIADEYNRAVKRIEARYQDS
jgi:integrase/recombinase XerD